MDQADLITRLTKGVMRDDLTSLYPDFINEALREIMRKRSWRYMLAIDQFTISAGNKSVALPSNFKELSTTRSPVNLVGNPFFTGGVNWLTPCDVWTRERVIRRERSLMGLPILNPNFFYRLSIPVWVDWQGEMPSLNIFYPATTDLIFEVKYFGYLPDLVKPTDSTGITNEYPEMCVAKCKAVAFEAINDPVADDWEEKFFLRFKEASANDSYASLAGIDLRM